MAILNRIQISVQLFLNSGSDKIREYCCSLCNDVRIKNDSLAAVFSRQSESMIDKIDTFEQKCLENFGDGAGLRTGLSKYTVESITMKLQ